jgi:EF-hand domain-containing family member D2
MFTSYDEHKELKFYDVLQFLLIFRKAQAGELPEDSGLYDIYRNMTEIDVDKEGVKGAKNFFEAKVSIVFK